MGLEPFPTSGPERKSLDLEGLREKAGDSEKRNQERAVSDRPDVRAEGVVLVQDVARGVVDDEPAGPLLAGGARHGQGAVGPAGRRDGRRHRDRARRLSSKFSSKTTFISIWEFPHVSRLLRQF